MMSFTQTKKWLIIRNGAVGDTLLLSPVLQAVRDDDPNAYIEIMGNLERIALLVGDGLADQATSFDQPGIESLFMDQGALTDSLKNYFSSFDVIVYYGQNRLEEIRSTLKVNHKQIVITHPAFPVESDVHITAHYLRAVQSLIRMDKPYIPWIVLREDEMDWGKRWLSHHIESSNESYVLGVHVGAGSKLKQAPFELFSHKVQEMSSQKKLLVLIPKGPAEDDVVEEFNHTLQNSITSVILEELQLRDLAAVLSQCDEFFGNDSGVTHLAAALGIPTTAVFVTGNPNVWKPLGECVNIIDLIP